MARNKRNHTFTFSEEECKRLEAQFAEKYPEYTVDKHSMCIFKRKRRLRCNNFAEKMYRVNLDLVWFCSKDRKRQTVYWSIQYYVNNEEYNTFKHKRSELNMMYDWVLERQANFEKQPGVKVILWRF